MPGLSLVLKVLANAKLPDALRLSGNYVAHAIY